jgi:hypothetical protein
MIQRFIENLEKEHHSRDDNRRVLPFEWGLEHVGLPPSHNPQLSLTDYAEAALRDSDAFYAYQPTAAYEFDGHVLRYPSYVETPYPENNTVYGAFSTLAAASPLSSCLNGIASGMVKSVFAGCFNTPV